MQELKVLFEDRDLIVAVKPSGTESESAKGTEPDMVNLIRNRIAKADPGKGEPYVGVVHRLDKPVEGIMVFAKNRETAAALSKQLAEGKMKKLYRAVLCGQPEAASGSLSDWIVQDGKTGTSKTVPKNTPGAKKADLKYRVTGKKYLEGERISEVEIELLTGRHHQIRVQFSSRGLPLLGDHRYNPAYLKADGKGRFLPPAGLCGKPCGENLALCAVSLSFVHPKSRKPMNFSIKPGGEAWNLF